MVSELVGFIVVVSCPSVSANESCMVMRGLACMPCVQVAAMKERSWSLNQRLKDDNQVPPPHRCRL